MTVGRRCEACGGSSSRAARFCQWCGVALRELEEWETPIGERRGLELELWRQQAERNVDEWGEQRVETLLLDAQEELGELTQAHLEARAEGADPARRGEELDDLGALCVQLAWALNRHPEAETLADRLDEEGSR